MSVNGKTKVGVIGLGVGTAHVSGYLAMPEVELVGICDINPERLSQVGDQYNVPNDRRFTLIDDLLAVPGIDAVSVALPNHLHAPISIQALKAGIHVLCEKPLARTAAEAQSIVDAATAAKRTLMVCFNYRYRADARWLKTLAADDRLGEVYYAKALWSRNSGIPGAGTWFTQKELSGGGPLIDLGVHVLDLALWLMGHPTPVSVSGQTFSKFGPRGRKAWGNTQRPAGAGAFDVEDLAAGFVRFADGRALSIETSWASQTAAGRDDYSVTLYGAEGGGELAVRNYSQTDTVTFFTEGGGQPVDIRPSLTAGGGHQLACQHFIDSVRADKAPDSPGEQGVVLMKIIDALYESARTGSEVKL